MSATSPIELPPPPRRLQRRPEFGFGQSAGRWFLRVFILPHTLAGAWLVLMAILTPIVELFGTDVSGKITDRRQATGRSNRTTYSVYFAYLVAGQDRNGNVAVTADEYDRAQVGDEYKVRVLPPLPKSFDQPRGYGSPGSKLFGLWLVAIFWNGILSLFLWRAWIKPWRLRNLVRDGFPAEGTITNKFPRGGGRGWPTYVVQYRYIALAKDDGDGSRLQSYDGETETAKSLFDRAQIGEAITILYRPRNPRRSVAYEFSEYQMRNK